MVDFQPRPKQAEVLSYTDGYIGVAAVPGSGKTWTLSVLASKLITQGFVQSDQEILIVTLVNSAVDNFSRRINELIQAEGLLPQVGYRVRTLHGLAHDIVRERPALVGLSNDFQIIDERAGESILTDISVAWLKNNPTIFDDYFDPEFDEGRLDWIRRERLPRLVSGIANNFIQYAKDNRLDPSDIGKAIDLGGADTQFARMGYEIYDAYQKALIYRGAVDFTDLIRLALQALQSDADYLARLRARWPYILEDEAQDSSLLQEEILRTLSGPQGNWVRVGDPNQAIFETFTTADPKYLREFIQTESKEPRSLPNSGRSSQNIIDLANYLITWTADAHPREEVRDALSEPFIKPAPPGDPQPNPPALPQEIQFIGKELSPEKEVEFVADSVTAWLANNPERTVAILVPRNDRGFKVVDAIRERGVEPIDTLLRSSTTTRMAAGAIANVMHYLADPKSPKRLATVYRVWRRDFRDDETVSERIATVNDLIKKKLVNVEEYIWPLLGNDWLESLAKAGIETEFIEELAAFREMVQRWHGTVLLPADQMVLTLAQDIFTNSTELAIAHKLSTLMTGVIREHRDWRLPELTDELAIIAKNERRFIGFSEDDQGFDPDSYKGQVVISTMHKAKGLEWDRVYMMSVSNYDFPSGVEFDIYMSEDYFIRNKLNLTAEAIEQLDVLYDQDVNATYIEGAASEDARIDYVKERIRLLYVGITRARQELVLTWNNGRRNDNQQALPFVALQSYWEDQR